MRQVTLTTKKVSLPQNDKKFDIVGLWKRVPFGIGFRFCLSNSNSLSPEFSNFDSSNFRVMDQDYPLTRPGPGTNPPINPSFLALV